MKTKLLKRLRREAERENPQWFVNGMRRVGRKYIIQDYILRRVAELKQKRK